MSYRRDPRPHKALLPRPAGVTPSPSPSPSSIPLIVITSVIRIKTKLKGLLAALRSMQDSPLTGFQLVQEVFSGLVMLRLRASKEENPLPKSGSFLQSEIPPYLCSCTRLWNPFLLLRRRRRPP